MTVKIEQSPIQENRAEQLTGAAQNPVGLGAGNRAAIETVGASGDKIELAGGQSLLTKAKEAGPMVDAKRLSQLTALIADGSYEPDPQHVSEGLLQETEEGG